MPGNQSCLLRRITSVAAATPYFSGSSTIIIHAWLSMLLYSLQQHILCIHIHIHKFRSRTHVTQCQCRTAGTVLYNPTAGGEQGAEAEGGPADQTRPVSTRVPGTPAGWVRNNNMFFSTPYLVAHHVFFFLFCLSNPSTYELTRQY